ncbi:MAG: hypothetical protein ABJ308_12945 [Halieaceae bacterium]
MSTDAIRKLISDAVDQESRSDELLHSLEQRLPSLQERLHLPDSEPLPALVEFIRRYIQYVPEFIDSLHTQSRGNGNEALVTPFLHMAEDFFLAPPQELATDHGLQALLDEAFLAQRLIEELNDRHLITQHSHLVPVDMTRANIIVHHLLGDALANSLDQLVEQSVSRLLGPERLFSEPGSSGSCESGQQQRELPCMSREVAIDLRLNGGGQV